MDMTSIRSMCELRTCLAEGYPVSYLFFWGHQRNREGRIGHECLSQWFPAPFVVDGVQYPSAEHYMMAEKARLFGDSETLAHIIASVQPGEAKQHGRRVRGFHDGVWEQHRWAVVVRGNLAKFSQHAALRTFLVATGHRVLVEASPHDALWGIGLAAHEARATPPAVWPGRNLLGFALMEVRARLRDTPGPSR